MDVRVGLISLVLCLNSSYPTLQIIPSLLSRETINLTSDRSAMVFFRDLFWVLYCSAFMLPLGQIIRNYDLGYHFYADDTLIYISSKSDINVTSSVLSECVQEIKMLMHRNFLKLNSSKTEVVLIGTKAAIHKGSSFNLSMANSVVAPSTHTRNLGVIFDAHLTLDSHIKSITKFAFHHLKNIARIRPFLKLMPFLFMHLLLPGLIIVTLWLLVYLLNLSRIQQHAFSPILTYNRVSTLQASFIAFSVVY